MRALNKAVRALNAENNKMSGQDEKWAIIGAAKEQYASLIGLLGRVQPDDYYSLLPAALEKAVRSYEKSPGQYDLISSGITSCMEFRDALRKSWKRVKLPSELKLELKEIATKEIDLWR